ncbi:MAG: hypothetical protein ACKO6H_05580 [Betaproteobacteria bacterium]
MQQRLTPEPHFIVAGTLITYPLLGTMMPLLFGMLGLGAYRTAEKVRGWLGDLGAALILEMATAMLLISERLR